MQRPQPTEDSTADRPTGRSRGLSRENGRLIVAVILAAVVTAFALLNLDQVDVNWLFGTWQTPLILVIAVSFVLGLAAGWIGGAMRRRS